MNKYIVSNSKKFLALLVLICVVFLVVIIKAFEYIPVADDDAIISRNNIENINKPAQDEAEKVAEENVENNEKKTLDITLTPDFVQKPKTEKPKEEKVAESLENITDLPSDAVKANSDGNGVVQANSDGSGAVQAEKKVELTPEEKAEKTFLTAQKYKRDRQFVKALQEYQKIPAITNDTSMVARSYEEIATIYAIVKKYGTALSYAQKAYNMSPSSSREMLLARLYYKTGDIDKATRRINNVLQRDFSSDR